MIIAGHGALAYGDLESAWPYQDVQEVQLAGVSNVALSAVVIPAALFAMGLFFLISGLVTPGSVSRKGPRTFARDRLIRLGVPLAVWTLVLWPGAIWAAHLAAGDTHSFWWQLTHVDPVLDTGPMWFVEVLLIYSLVYAAWRYWRRRRATGDDPRAVSGLAAPRCPVGRSSRSPPRSRWPPFSCVPSFPPPAARSASPTCGSGRSSWRCSAWGSSPPSAAGSTRCPTGFAADAALPRWAASWRSAIVAVTMAATGVDGDVLFDSGLHWAPLSLAAIEGPLAVGASVWLLGLAQRRLNRRPGPLGRAMARSAYGAFVLQGVVLIGLMIALRPIGVPAEVKALAVAGLGVAGSFALAWVLVTRTRLGRII